MSAVIDSKLYDLSKLVANQKVTTRNRRRKSSRYIAYQSNYYDDLQQNNNKILNSPFIENAAYFLKEHFIQITCFQTSHIAYIRLIGDNFSIKYENMMKQLISHYNNNNITKFKTYPELDKICSAYDYKNQIYFRAQIKKLENQYVQVC